MESFSGDLYKCMFSLTINPNLIRFKRVLADLQGHGLGGKGQRKAGGGHPVIKRLFGCSRPARSQGALVCHVCRTCRCPRGRASDSGQESWEALCNAAAGVTVAACCESPSQSLIKAVQSCLKRGGTSACFAEILHLPREKLSAELWLAWGISEGYHKILRKRSRPGRMGL